MLLCYRWKCSQKYQVSVSGRQLCHVMKGILKGLKITQYTATVTMWEGSMMIRFINRSTTVSPTCFATVVDFGLHIFFVESEISNLKNTFTMK